MQCILCRAVFSTDGLSFLELLWEKGLNDTNIPEAIKARLHVNPILQKRSTLFFVGGVFVVGVGSLEDG